ncbi:MAG: hypothetical protein NWE96_08150 [Candidatus Bathyarchaeota archaeon]|nr:hypothetical protein [Candidatus Bathyarchaeota archaeon]
MKKTSTLALIIVLFASGLMLVESASAQSISKPAVPQFTLKFVDASYDVPTTYSMDPYTGATVEHSGYHVQNRTIEVSIRNQPFTKYQSNGQIIDFYLNIRTKGSYAKEWIQIYSPSRGFLTQSGSEYTVVSYSLDDNEFPFWDNINQSGGQVDFQVQALIGAVHRIQNGSQTDPLLMFPWIFEGQTSEWSNTQTITIPQTTPSPSVPELPTFALIPLLLAVPLIAVFALRKKPTQNSTVVAE